MGSASKSSSGSGSAAKWARPFAIEAASDVSSVYDLSDNPYLNSTVSPGPAPAMRWLGHDEGAM